VYSLITWLHAGIRPRDFAAQAGRTRWAGYEQ